jgi:hypothetical protein
MMRNLKKTAMAFVALFDDYPSAYATRSCG